MPNYTQHDVNLAFIKTKGLAQSQNKTDFIPKLEV